MSNYFDTSFLIDILQNDKNAVQLLHNYGDEINYTGSINVHEFLSGAYNSVNEEQELNARKKILRKLIILPFDEKSAKESSTIERNLKKVGNVTRTVDILIAGIMKSNGINSIITKNSFFNKIGNIKVIEY